MTKCRKNRREKWSYSIFLYSLYYLYQYLNISSLPPFIAFSPFFVSAMINRRAVESLGPGNMNFYRAGQMNLMSGPAAEFVSVNLPTRATEVIHHSVITARQSAAAFVFSSGRHVHGYPSTNPARPGAVHRGWW